MLSFAFSALALSTPLRLQPQTSRATPSVRMGLSKQTDRRGALLGFAVAALGLPPAFAGDVPDESYKLRKDYIIDSQNMLVNMKIATDLQRGNPDIVRRRALGCARTRRRGRRCAPGEPVRAKELSPRPRTLRPARHLLPTLLASRTLQEKIVKSTRSEMNDFVAFYRRQPKISGMPSFSTLYTAINTLSGAHPLPRPPSPSFLLPPTPFLPRPPYHALLHPLRRPPSHPSLPLLPRPYPTPPSHTSPGHYASYGNKYPVPEKRKTRLAQQYKEIERALARGK